MGKMYYISYETIKNKLSLNPENENSDRITLMFCNQLVKTAIEELGVNEEEKEKYLENIIIKIFTNASKMNQLNNETIPSVHNMSEVFDALKETILVL